MYREKEKIYRGVVRASVDHPIIIEKDQISHDLRKKAPKVG